MRNRAVAQMEAYEQGFQRLARDYARKLPCRVARIEALWHGSLSTGWDATACSRLREVVHGLKGSGGTFGQPRITHAAHSLERSLRAVAINSDGAPTLRTRQELEARIQALRRAADRAKRDAVLREELCS